VPSHHPGRVAGRRGFIALLLAPAFLFGAAAPSSGQGSVPGASGGVYRRPLEHDPATLDPARVRDVYSLAVSQQLFDGLVRFDQTIAVVPALAEFWKASRDGLNWTFTLRKGVTFHHGREVTAEDVVYSFTRIIDPRTKSGAADLFLNIRGAREFREGRTPSVTGLRAVDRYKVQFELIDSPVPFVSTLAVGHAKIVPRDVVERDPEGFGRHPVGTGPFRFVRWERGREIVLAANPGYFDGPPKLDQVVYRIFAGGPWASMYEEFERGHLEDAPIPTQDYQRILADRRYTYVKRSMISIRFYGLNMRVPPLDDRRVRQALNHAIDREALIGEVHSGRFTPARGILPPGTQGYNPRLVPYAYQPDRARELLAEAGYPGGRGLPTLEIWSSVKHPDILREHEYIQRSLEAVGVRVRFNYQTDWPTFSRALDEGKFPAFLYAWYADVPDPDNFLSKLFHSRSPRNFFGYANAAIDELLVAARRERDPGRRTELYRRAEQMVLDDAPFIPILHHTYERVFQPYVRSIEVNGLGDPYIPLRKIWLDRKP
jgi:peptide/nickel transport system substrate-binding protein/oligopeptide transport system substrate-binding protein